MKTSTILLIWAALFATEGTRIWGGDPTPQTPEPGADWPASIDTNQGFHELGKAIRRDPGFPPMPANVNPIELNVQRARYVFSQLRTIVKKYGLKTGATSTIVSRWFGSNRGEDADSLKASQQGLCGEWTNAFTAILEGADIPSYIVFGDIQGSGYVSPGAASTDTILYVGEEFEQKGKHTKKSRRAFDIYRAVQAIEAGEAWTKWGDLPLTDDDKWKGETKKSWQKTVFEESTMGRAKFIKDGNPVSPGYGKPLPTINPKTAPGDTPRPTINRPSDDYDYNTMSHPMSPEDTNQLRSGYGNSNRHEDQARRGTARVSPNFVPSLAEGKSRIQALAAQRENELRRPQAAIADYNAQVTEYNRKKAAWDASQVQTHQPDPGNSPGGDGPRQSDGNGGGINLLNERYSQQPSDDYNSMSHEMSLEDTNRLKAGYSRQ